MADIYDDMSAIRRREMIDNLCEVVSEDYAEFAYYVGGTLQNIYEASAPSSKERTALLDMLKSKLESIEDEQYLQRKRLAERISPDSTARKELIYWVLANARLSARIIAYKEPGKSRLTYRRLIEQACKYPPSDRQ